MSSVRLVHAQNNAKRAIVDKSMVGTDIPYLAEGILSEILSYLDVNSLLVCKSVCKLWYSTIKEDEFVKMHMRRNNGRFHVFKHSGKSLNSDGTEETYKYLSSINGLLLVRRSSATKRTRYQIGNPSTKETLDIPYPTVKGCLMAITLYLNSSTGLYYLVSVFSDRICSNYIFQVLKLGHPGIYPPNSETKYLSWRNLIFGEMFNLNEEKKYIFRIQTTQVGMLYVLKTLIVGLGKPEIICVDLVQETCTTCIGPESISHDRNGLIFQLWQENPTILSLVKDELTVWVLEDYKKGKWSDKFSILLTYLNEYPRLKGVVPVFFHADGEDVLLYKYSSVCYVYKLKSKEFCAVEPSTGKYIKVAETLVSLKGMRPEEECFPEIEKAT